MKAKRIPQDVQNKINKVSKIMIYAIVFCCASPFLYMFLLQIWAAPKGMDIMTYVEQDPFALVNMLASFINPFAGLALNYIRKRMLEYGPADVIYRGIILLLIGELCMMNTLYIFIMIYLLYRVRGIYKEKYRIAWRASSVKEFFTSASASITVLILYVFVAILTIRVMYFV